MDKLFRFNILGRVTTSWTYNRHSFKNPCATRCSSISATQSFDMRVYGRTGPSGSATLGRPQPKPKLENKSVQLVLPHFRVQTFPRFRQCTANPILYFFAVGSRSHILKCLFKDRPFGAYVEILRIFVDSDQHI